jgi:hypothetical protein
MRRRKTIRSLPVVTSRWTVWAAQLAARHRRATDLSRLTLLLQMPALARTLVFLQQRWLSSSLRVQPQLNLSISSSSVWNVGASNAYTSQKTFLNSLLIAIAGSRTPGSESGVRRTDPPSLLFENRKRAAAGHTQESQPRLAMTLAIARTTAEYLSTTLNRHFSVRRDAYFMEASKLLTERVRRVSDGSVVHPPMALRLSPANRVTPQHVFSEAMPEVNSFERLSSPPSVPAIAMQALNFEQLADQVLKQIDRRVVARRERMGKI